MSDQQVKKRLRQSGSQYRLQKQRRSEENSKQGSALLQFLKPANSELLLLNFFHIFFYSLRS
jgi:hypothetical protein